jgi:hypothetical protein
LTQSLGQRCEFYLANRLREGKRGLDGERGRGALGAAVGAET